MYFGADTTLPAAPPPFHQSMRPLHKSNSGPHLYFIYCTTMGYQWWELGQATAEPNKPDRLESSERTEWGACKGPHLCPALNSCLSAQAGPPPGTRPPRWSLRCCCARRPSSAARSCPGHSQVVGWGHIRHRGRPLLWREGGGCMRRAYVAQSSGGQTQNCPARSWQSPQLAWEMASHNS